MTDAFDISGRTVLVTGGARGIGRMLAEGLLRAGARVIISTRKEDAATAAEAELRAAVADSRPDADIHAVAADISTEEGCQVLVGAVQGITDRLDGLVNNAGATWGAPTLDFPLEKWDQVFNVNVRGVWVLTQKVARIMKEQGGGNIINISSVMSFRGSTEEGHPAIPYNSTKAAINLLTMNLAVKLAPFKIRVNAIAPGFFHTDMMAYIDKPEFKAVRDAIINEIPLRRVGDMDDMKGVAVFLASPASAFMTGHVLVVDGGQIAK